MQHSVRISGKQIRAARALLDWSQEDLAAFATISCATVRKLELGHISPRGKTTQSLRFAFERAGLEFIEPDGVRQRPEDITVYQGRDGTINFFNDVYETASRRGGEIILVCDSEQPFVDALGAYEKIYIQKMTSIKDRMSMKCLITEDDTCLPCSNYSAYRRLSKGYVDSVPFYIYDDKYAIFVFGGSGSPKITVIQSRVVAEAFRKQFRSMWDKAAPLTPAQTTPGSKAKKLALKRMRSRGG